MKLYFIFLALLFSVVQLSAQNPQQKISKVIDDFFVAMESKDTIGLDTTMHPNAIIYSTYYDEKGRVKNEVLHKVSLMGFMRRAVKKKYIYDEKLWSFDIRIEDNMATVWAEYTLFVGEKLDKISHCGTNVFQLIRNENLKWVLVTIVDTRRWDNCIEKTSLKQHKDQINTFLNDWHKAAAKADANAFFGAMTEDAIYLGTDATERWQRDELRQWSKFAFDRESAWDFKASKREIYFSDNQKMAWFEESLATEMGTCRGSGVLVKVGKNWKLKHYDLSIMVPNELVKCFLKLVKKGCK